LFLQKNREWRREDHVQNIATWLGNDVCLFHRALPCELANMQKGRQTPLHRHTLQKSTESPTSWHRCL